MQLRYLSVPALIAAAGGDPWAINATLQAGSPLQISNLAEAFRKAGRCTKEANDAFEQARTRFEAAWNHQDGDHPITGSDEVQRVTKALGAQSLQIPKIGADLENIAATLAEAQRTAAPEGVGMVGALAMQIAHELGTIDSASQSRIVMAEKETLIAQLTVTALHDSSIDRARIWLTARPGPAAVPASAGPHRAPGSGTREGH